MTLADFERLVDLTLADGVITPQEQNVLLKRAAEINLSPDEVQIIIDSRLYERNQRVSQNNSKQQAQSIGYGNSQPSNPHNYSAASAPPPQGHLYTPPPQPRQFPPQVQQVKRGVIQKCPACGATVNDLTTVCPSCGFEFSGVGANANIASLMRMLDDLEAERDNSVFSKFFTDAFGIADSISLRKKELIRNFPIPNTKADLVEFLSMAVPNSQVYGSFLTRKNPEYKAHNDMAGEWATKCRQIMIKARFLLRDDPQTLQHMEMLASGIGKRAK